MKKSKSLRSLCLLALFAGSLGQINAAPYGNRGREVSWVQPNGKKLNLKVFGDEYYGRTETSDGYTVVYNPADGYYHYAGVDLGGGKFAPTGVKAEEAPPRTLRQHVDLPASSVKAIANAREALLNGDRAERWADRVAGRQGLPAAKNGAGPQAKAAAVDPGVVGSKVGLTILVQFPNDPQTGQRDPVNFPTTQEKIQRFCNSPGYVEDGNAGSVYDYFFDQSGGKLQYTQLVTPIITMPKARNYYNFEDYPKNRKLRQNSGDLLLTDAIAELKSSGFKFDGLTTSNGNVVATNLFFAGKDSGVWPQGLWPYQTSLRKKDRINVGTDLKPLYIRSYQQTNIEDNAPVIGTFCHENGHLLLDYSDLYDYGGESLGVGFHCLMGAGNSNDDGRTPSPINAYFKDVVGWGNVQTITSSDSFQATLPTTGNVAYRIRKPGTPTEYFIVENRGDGDKWAQYSVDKGIAVWHIDEKKFGDDEEQMTSAKHYEVSLEQADGLFDLEKNVNPGDTKDLFDLSKPAISDTTLPNTKWWSGAVSGFKMRVLSDTGSSATVQFGQLPPDTIIVGNPNGAEVLYTGGTTVIDWEANITGNVKIELFKGGSFFTVISANEANTGKFTWSLPATLTHADDYTIVISSLTNTIPTSDTSNLPFTVAAPSFPAGNELPLGWFKPKSANKGWRVTNSTSYEGGYCLTNKVLGDGKTAEIAYRSNFKAGKVTFRMKVSSEKSFDFGKFYIDGVSQTLDKSFGTRGISGTSKWVLYSFDLKSGNHTLKWSFEKDDSYLSGKDAVWLDAVNLPETTQEIAVEYPVGTEIQSGDTTVNLDSTRIGETSASRTITVKNVGKADLTGLQVVKFGANSGDFKISSLRDSVLGAGESLTFKVSFSPSDFGLRTSTIQILSSDADEPAFSINLDGTGLRSPKIQVYQPSTNALVNGKSTVDFSYATVDSSDNVRVFTVKNAGSSDLDSLAVDATGTNARDFQISSLGVLSLAPGESTTFNVTFSPNAINDRSAELKITSNDKGTGTFVIKVTGIGAPRINASSALATSSSGSGLSGVLLQQKALKLAAAASATTSVEVVNGKKYLSLTVNKPADTEGVVRTVEVSSNLLDWYSGKKHTTTLLDNATTLKVRDNTPTTSDDKRHIRLKVTQP